MTRPNIADLQKLFWGGGAEAEYQTLQQYADAGVNAATLLSGGGGGGAALQSTVVYTGVGAPGAGFGVSGDMYIDQTTGAQYVLGVALVWSQVGNVGPDLGAAPDPASGVDGDYAYAIVDGFDVVYQRVDGAWVTLSGVISFDVDPTGIISGVAENSYVLNYNTGDLYQYVPAPGGEPQWTELAVLATAGAGGGGGGGLTVVEHGADANYPRPEGALVVYWIGEIEPLNRTGPDLFYNTAQALDPLSITGHRIWIDASATETLTLDGSNNVTAVGNLSVGGDGTVPNSTLPLTTTATGLPGIKFSESGAGIVLPATAVSGTIAPFHAFVVYQPDSIALAQQAIFNFGTVPSGTKIRGLWQNGSQMAIVQYGSDVSAAVGTAVVGELMIAEIYDDGTDVFLLKNGAQIATIPSRTADYSLISQQTRFGSLSFTSGSDYRPMDAVLCEALVYNTPLGSEDASAVRNYLAGKWGITLS